jgi:hypothetical protein
MELVNLLKKELKIVYRFGDKLIQEYLIYFYVIHKGRLFHKKVGYINPMLSFQTLYNKTYNIENKLISINKNMHRQQISTTTKIYL